ncbi:MAG: LysR family transcriptional regulator [Alteromonadaceae bacterium]|nr:LysR family transcriptional regulator [Alteromonadaceae bacterium]|tara:strand:+ start:1268 stop:2215 length:948 start_codon:yes stop_codon:yes gene_type:complete
MYDLKELEAFAAVVASGSLSLTSREMNLPKSTLSRRIRQLEASIGQPLLRREANQLTPNDAGLIFYKYCVEMLTLARQSAEALNELRREVTGELVIRSHEALMRGWLAQAVERFMSQHQAVNIRVHTQTSAPSGQAGHKSRDSGGRDNICLWLGQLGQSPLRQELLGSLSQGIYAHPDYLDAHGRPETPNDLHKHHWINRLGRPDGTKALALHHSVHGAFAMQPPATCIQFDQYCLQGDAIVRKQGLGLLPHWMVEQRLRAHPGTLELCLPEWQGPALPVWLLYPHGTLPRRTRAFLTHLREALPAGWNSQQHAA